MDGAAQSVIDVPPYCSASVSVDAAFRDDSLGAMKSTTHSVWRFRIIVSIGWAYLGITGLIQAALSNFVGAIATDTLGNVYVTGTSFGSGTARDYATVKYNSSGTQQWVARYNGPASTDDIAYAIAVDGSGNVYVTGSSGGSGTGLDYATVKYNSSGVQQWVARYNGPASTDDIAYAIAVDGSGNVYVTGSSGGSGTGLDYATVKYNSSGTQQWASRYNGPASGDDIAYAVAVDSSGNVYVTGSSLGSGTSLDYATVKYNSSGTQQWASRYNGPASSDDKAHALVIDGSSNVYVTGSSLGSGTSLDYATVKYNSSGAQQWASRYNGPANSDDVADVLNIDIPRSSYLAKVSFGR
jgi:Beta-propeller repeat